MMNTLLKADAFANQIGLTFNKKGKRHNTMCGMICSIMLGSTMICLAVILATLDTDNFTTKQISSEGSVVPVTNVLLYFEAYSFSTLKRLDISPETNKENFIAVIEHIDWLDAGTDSISQI